MSGAKAPTGLSETSGCVAECMAMRLGAGAGCARRQKVAFAVAPTGETGSHFGRTPPSDGAQYVHRVSRVRQVIASYGLDVLIVVLALACAASTALRHDPYRPGDVQLNFELAAVAAMVLTLLLRHRAPFGAPAATWLLSAALSFLDGRLIVGQAPLPIAGMVAAVLLGNLRSCDWGAAMNQHWISIKFRPGPHCGADVGDTLGSTQSRWRRRPPRMVQVLGQDCVPSPAPRVRALLWIARAVRSAAKLWHFTR